MPSQIIKLPLPARYQQPGQFHEDRMVTGTFEAVDYLPQTHLRIWYNNELGYYDTHHHSAMEIIVAMENQTVVIAGNETYRLNVGDILIIPPHMLHKLIFDGTGVRFIYLIDREMLRCYHEFQTLDPLFMRPFYCTSALFPAIYKEVYDGLIEMTDIYFENRTFGEIQIFGIFLRLTALIGNHYVAQTVSREADALGSKQMEYFDKFSALLSYIDANCVQDLSLEQVARQAGFSKFHFSRLFKLYTNTTFYNYLCHKRIQVAQSLLTSETSITNIALECGFNNLTTFCRCFKKYTGCSPTEYRSRLLEEA